MQLETIKLSLFRRTFHQGPSEEVGPICSKLSSKTPTSLFNVGVFNARSIRNKTEFLFELAEKNSTSYDLIFVVESWLDERTADAQICPKE